jgi:drug/metabolite transporter (DMT)-like permease
VTVAGRPDRATLLAFTGAVLFGGLNTIAVRATVKELDPEWGAGIRFVAAGLIMAALTLARGRRFPSGQSLRGAMIYGVFGFAIAFGLIYPALRHVQAGTAAVVIALAPLATYALAIAQGQEAFRPQGLLGALVALAGIGIVFVDQLGAAVPIGDLILVLIGTISLSEAAIVVKRIPRSDPFGTNAVAMATAGIILVVVSLALGERHALPTRTDTWLAVTYITVFGSVVLFGLYVFGISRWTASGMSYSTLMFPFVSVTVARFLTGEVFSSAFLLGGLVMLAGVYIGAFGVHRPKRSTATSQPECMPIGDCADAIPAALRSSGERA